MNARTLVTNTRNVLVLVLLLGTGLIPVHSQVEAGRFVGRITDTQGAVVTQAIVKVTNVGTNSVQSAVSDSTGNFVITPVAAGVYSLSVTAPGFTTINTSNIEVQRSEEQRLNSSHDVISRMPSSA